LRPPSERRTNNPWPQWPYIFRTSSSHDEGGSRDFGVMTKELLGTPDGKVRALKAVHVNFVNGKFEQIAGSEFELPADLVLLAMGFVGSAKSGIIAQLGVTMDARGNVATTNHQTNVGKVFAAGDMSRGQSLVVWAIAEGRQAAEAVDNFLAQKP
jgi:glutamate synthase (NADPH/NADH) small chain